MKLRKAFLWAVLGSLAVAAFIGVQSLLFDLRSGRWIGTMFSIVLFSLTSLGASIALERRVWVRAMGVAIGISLVALAFMVINIWSDSYNRQVTRLIGVVTVWAIALPVGGLLAMARFDGALVSVRNVVIGLVMATGGFISLAVVAEPRDEYAGRLLGAMVIVTLLGVVSVPILYKMHGIERREGVETSPLEVRLTCPRCLLEQTAATGPSRCTQCRLKFTIEIEEPRCPECNYLLYRLTTPRCPECGHALGSEEVEAADRSTVT